MFKLDFDDLQKSTKNNTKEYKSSFSEPPTNKNKSVEKDMTDKKEKETKKEQEDTTEDKKTEQDQRSEDEMVKKGKFDEEEDEDGEEDEKEKKDSISNEELVRLREKAAKYDALEQEFSQFKKDFTEIKEERANEQEQKRLDMIKTISESYYIPADEFKNDSIESLEKFTKRMDMALNKENEEKEKQELSLDEKLDFISEREKQLRDKYVLKV